FLLCFFVFFPLFISASCCRALIYSPLGWCAPVSQSATVTRLAPISSANCAWVSPRDFYFKLVNRPSLTFPWVVRLMTNTQKGGSMNGKLKRCFRQFSCEFFNAGGRTSDGTRLELV